MMFYITVLRALAAIIITNAHYVGVYPTDLIANGGLLGDVIFFAVSGFCLVNIRQNFSSWYVKRMIRIFPIVWIITTIYLLLGFYSLNEWNLANYYLYPTFYHFVASIMVLYIPFYFIIKSKVLSKNIPKIMVGLFVIELLVYFFIYDKSTYHIDTVREPMIRFLFFLAMLLGAYFRKFNDKFKNKNKIYNWAGLFVVFFMYFVSKLALVRIDELSQYQILNQVLLFVLLYFVLRCFAGIDNKLEALPLRIKSIINFIATITLEIYVVQYVIIPRFASFVFPLNWVVITTVVLLSAYILHLVSNLVIKNIQSLIDRKVFIKKGVKE